MANFRDGTLQQGQAFQSVSKTVYLTADNTAVPIDLETLILIGSDNTTAANRTFTLGASTVGAGHVVTLIFNTGASTTCQLADSGTMQLTPAWEPVQYDTLTLMSDGTNWNELSRGTSAGNVTSAAITDGEIVNADINASAAIAYSKLATLASGRLIVGSAGNVATAVDVTGDVTISNAGVTAIGSGVVVNADVSGSAAIDYSKLATLASGRLVVGSAGNVATAVDVTGDVTISSTGVTTIGAAKVTEAMQKSYAAAGLHSKRIAYGIFDATAGKTQAAHTLGATIPDNAFIIGAWYWVSTTFTSAGDNATIALSIEGANDLFTATAISSGTTWDATALPIEGVPKLETTTTWVRTTAARDLTASVAVEDLTAGVMHVWAEYIVSSV